MKNYKLILEYDGSRYSGWTRLGKEEAANTIENKIREVLKKKTGQEPEISCASRTETGVHAYGQAVSVLLDCADTPESLKRYLNRYLPMDIAVLEAEEMSPRFRAALNASSRTYLYRIAVGDVPSVFERKYTYYSFGEPDVDKMRAAAAKLVGRHDFRAFSTAKKNKSTVKEIFSLDVYGDAQEIQITVTANDFLHNVARMIASTLLDVGLGRRPASDVERILSPDDAAAASAPADPCGLFLDHVDFSQPT